MGDDIIVQILDYDTEGLLHVTWEGLADEFLAANNNYPPLVDAVAELRGGLERVSVDLGASGEVCLARVC